jgi:hypothetical protein
MAMTRLLGAARQTARVWAGGVHHDRTGGKYSGTETVAWLAAARRGEASLALSSPDHANRDEAVVGPFEGEVESLPFRLGERELAEEGLRLRRQLGRRPFQVRLTRPERWAPFTVPLRRLSTYGLRPGGSEIVSWKIPGFAVPEPKLF